MMNKTITRCILLTLAAGLAACATNNGPTVAGQWRDIGLSSSGNVRHAIDTGSIHRQGNLAIFRDKKTVIDMKQERFSNTPAYKVAVGNWEIDCTRRTFRLTALQLLDERGNIVSQAQYSATDLRPMAVMRGSATEQQYNLVCKK